VAFIEQQLADWWQATRPPSPLGSHLLDDWFPGLLMRAANSGPGRSARQIERRIKQWTGQPLRELRGITRSEKAFFQTVMAQEQGPLNWAALASETGYTDQSHLCRQTRRMTGFAPEELRRRIMEDESFWPYRLWGFSEARSR
jgi:AraC-like DNA-binding protein